MIELSRTQDQEVGDGTTSVIILGMLLCDLIENSGFCYTFLNSGSDLTLIFGPPYCLTVIIILYFGCSWWDASCCWCIHWQNSPYSYLPR